MIRRTACLIARSDDPYRNQAIERHLMDTLPDETAVLYLWQSRPAVLIGRGQNPWYECPAFLAENGTVGRRLSGGGAMYLDPGCLHFSFILPKSAFDIPRQLSILGMAVGAFGIQAQASGRNDLSVMGNRFCANAFFKSGSAALHHGAMLVNASLGAMLKALSVEEGKLPPGMKKPLASMGNLADLHRGVTMESLQESLYFAFGRTYGSEAAMLDERMLHAPSIDAFTEQFANPSWIFPSAFPYTFTVTERFPWGGVTVQLMTDHGIIRGARIYSDAMESALFDPISQSLTGAPFLISAISTRIQQKLAWLTDPRLLQMAGDVSTLICGRIRSMDRMGDM